MLAWGACVHVHGYTPFLRTGLLGLPPERPACIPLPSPTRKQPMTTMWPRGHRVSSVLDITCSCLTCHSDPASENVCAKALTVRLCLRLLGGKLPPLWPCPRPPWVSWAPLAKTPISQSLVPAAYAPTSTPRTAGTSPRPCPGIPAHRDRWAQRPGSWAPSLCDSPSSSGSRPCPCRGPCCWLSQGPAQKQDKSVVLRV